MSLVVSWIAVHANGASLYLAADSRISWGAWNRWDHAQKVFASPRTGELFGYAGDVLFPTQTLSQVCQLAQTGVLFPLTEAPEKRVERYRQLIQLALVSYPKDQLAEAFDILYACHHANRFFLFKISSTKNHELVPKKLEIDPKSAPIEVLGSGCKPFWEQYKNEPQTGYGIFHALAKVIDNEADPKVGGIPQVASLYSDGRTNTYGLSYFGTTAVLGLEVNAPGCPHEVEWRNENFERWDVTANALIKGTQRQPRLAPKPRQRLP